MSSYLKLFLRTHCSIFDVSHMLQSRVEGRDRLAFMEGITVADVAGLAHGQVEHCHRCLLMMLPSRAPSLSSPFPPAGLSMT